jgi:hypothetical protein
MTPGRPSLFHPFAVAPEPRLPYTQDGGSPAPYFLSNSGLCLDYQAVETCLKGLLSKP